MIKEIKETSLYVKNLEATRVFYEERLGLKVIILEKNRHVFFRAGSSVLLCFLHGSTKNGSLPSHAANGSIHVAFEVAEKDYFACKDKIKKAHIESIQEQEWKTGLKSFYFRDPDGNLLEIVQEGVWNV